MASGEAIKLYDVNDNLIDVVEVPPHYMEGEPVRWIIAHGRKFVEGGGPNSYYGRGQFAEEPPK